MSRSISSAEPKELHHYSESAIRIDLDLLATSNTLAGILHQFEATCTEPAFRVHVSPVADVMGGHARSAEPVDRWVGDISRGFVRADSGALGQYAPLIGSDLTVQQQVLLAAALGSPLVSMIKNYLQSDNASVAVGYLRWLVASKEGLQYLGDYLGPAVHDGWGAIEELLQVAKLDPRLGSYYDGEVIIKGGHDLKGMLGWSTNLTHMKMSTGGIVKLSGQSGVHSFQHSLKEGIKPTTGFGALLLLAQVGITGYDNWQDYHDEDMTKVVTGTVVDSSIQIGCTAVGAGVGTFLGGALLGAGLGAVSGGALAPVGVAIGGRVGGFVGGLAGNWVAGKILETDADEWATDKLDEAVDWVSEDLLGVDIDKHLADAVNSVVSLF